MWKTRASVVPIVIGALGVIYHLSDWMEQLHIYQKKLNNYNKLLCWNQGIVYLNRNGNSANFLSYVYNAKKI